MKRIIQFGAGNIGRGFLAQIFTQNGYKVIFVDVNRELIDALNKKKSYIISIVGGREICIDNFLAINGKNIAAVGKEITNVKIIVTAVGVNALESAASLIAKGIKQRARLKIHRFLNIIVAENLLDASSILKKHILNNLTAEYKDYINGYLGFAAAVVRRRVPYVSEKSKKENPLKLYAENYNILPVDKNGFRGVVPKIEGINFADNIQALIEQKLFLHNSGYAIAGYLGYMKGYRTLHEAMDDRKIYDIVSGAMYAIGEGLVRKHGFALWEQRDYIGYLLKLFQNKMLVDSVEGLARDPIRKLGENDRLIGPAKLLLGYGIVSENIAWGIAAALCYDNPRDSQAVKLKQILEEKGVGFVLEHICKLRCNGELTSLVEEKYYTISEMPG